MLDSDYTPYVSSPRMQQLIGTDMTAIQSFEPTAQQMITDALFERYDVAAIFGAAADQRSSTVILWMRTIVMYFVWEKVDDKLRPESVKLNYNNTIAQLNAMQRGDINVQLSRLEVWPDGSQVKTKFRGGSEPKFRDDPRTKGRRWRWDD